MKHLRTGIAMIELIFALVIMGIVMMSAPMLISQSQKSTQVVLQQEAIAAGASDINMILSRYWDEADTNTTLGAPVLRVTTTGGSAVFEPTASTPPARVGTPATKSNRHFFSSNDTELNATISSRFGPVVATTLENDDVNSSYDDIDDFATINEKDTLIEADAALRGDLVDTGNNTGSKGMLFDTKIAYIVDANTTYKTIINTNSITYTPFDESVTGTSNVKMVQVTVTTDSGIEELEKKIILKAFSSNIGEYELAKKGF